MSQFQMIKVRHGKIKELAEKFQVNAITVRKALRFDKSVITGDLIREEALKSGGYLMQIKSEDINQ